MKGRRGAFIAMRFASLCLALAACGHAPPAPAPPSSPPLPAELRIAQFADVRDNPRFLADRIYVLGRSDDRIAYLTEPADEACGCYTPEIVIQTLLGNEIVWKDSYDSGMLDDPKPGQIKNLAELWRARGADWEHHLREQGIARADITALEPLPADELAVHTTELDDPKYGFVHLTSYRIDQKRSDEPRTIDESTSPMFTLTGVDVLGYVPGEVDGMAAVLVLDTHRGWEGPPSVHNLRFVGAEHIGVH